MRKYIYPILCTLLIVSQGCDHFLGNKPKGYAIPEAFEDYVKLLASQSLNSCMSTDAFYLTDDVHLLDDTVSAADLAYANQDDHTFDIYRHDIVSLGDNTKALDEVIEIVIELIKKVK